MAGELRASECWREKSQVMGQELSALPKVKF